MNPFPLLFLLGISLLYGAISFVIFFFGSQWTEQPLTRQEALTTALLLAFCTGIFTAFFYYSEGLFHIRILYGGIGITATVIMSQLIKKYDCDVVPSLLMVLGGLFLPSLILMWLISLFH